MPRKPPLLQALAPQVTAFEIADLRYQLIHDLEMLERVREVEATEAIAFYAARILEAMTRGELRHFCQPRESMHENVRLLVEYCRLPGSLIRWIHRLREIGNDARHIQRHLTPQDGDLAFAILLRWLDWYFCQYPAKHNRLPALFIYNQPLDSLLNDDLAGLLGQLEQGEGLNADFIAGLRLDRSDSLVLMSPVLPAVLVEVLLGRGRFEEALSVLTVVRKEFPRDLRLAQLEALYHSRLGRKNRDTAQLQKARKILERLRGVDSAADEETLGMLGGVLKLLSEFNGDDVGLLQNSHRTYRRGWDRSGERNNYLGINAATTALLLGQTELAAHLAGQVRVNLEELFAELTAAEEGPRPASFWDQATLAEALLVAGETDAAGQRYRKVFQEYRTNSDEIKIVRDQARRVLERQNLADCETDVLGPTPTPDSLT